MKKLLVFFLVLGMASLAQASFELSINGAPASQFTDILAPSDWIELDITKTDADLFGIGDLAIQVTGPAHLAYGGSDPEAPDLGPISFIGTDALADVPTAYVTGADAGGVTILETSWKWDLEFDISPLSDASYLKVFGGNATNNTFGPYTLLDNVWLHCDGDGPVTVDLIAASSLRYMTYSVSQTPIGYDWAVEDYVETVAVGTIMDSVTIEQIPEPMTMSLLGLGGLALLRRRRA